MGKQYRTPSVPREVYDARFFPFGENGLEVSFAAVFRGAETVAKLKGAEWLEHCVHIQERPKNPETPPSIKFYLLPEYLAENNALDFAKSLECLGEIISPLEVGNFGRFDWTFRITDFVSAFCARISELETAQARGHELPIFGFGKPHPFSATFKQANPKLTGPLADFFPGSTLPPGMTPPWLFEPVWIGESVRVDIEEAEDEAGDERKPFVLKTEVVWSPREEMSELQAPILRSTDLSLESDDVPAVFREAFWAAYPRFQPTV